MSSDKHAAEGQYVPGAGSEAERILGSCSPQEAECLRVLWGIGLLPQAHPNIVSAARGAARIVETLREQLHNPPPDVQERVLEILKLQRVQVVHQRAG